MRAFLAVVAAATLLSCGPREELYNACDVPDDCEVPDGADAECLDKSGQGFCTWACDTDDDCADDADEDFDFVCASFESETGKHCFPSCDDPVDPENECPTGYGCRSTGGGSENRKVCFPSDGTTGS